MEVLPPFEFEWDKHNAGHVRKRHQIEPSECEEVFLNLPLTVQLDPGHSQSEGRYHALGKTNTERILLVVFTVRNKKIRVVTAREPSRKERTAYEKT